MRKTVLSIFGVLLIVAGVGVAVTATLVTFILPSKFAATARIAPAVTGQTAVATEVQKIQSGAVLSQVTSNLNLSKRWGEKFKEGELPMNVTKALLRNGLVVEQVRSTDLIEIRVENDSAEEEAEIANQIAEVYRASSLAPAGAGGKPGVEIVDNAQPNFRPAKPNKPLNIAIGCVAGGVLGAIGFAMIVLAMRKAGNAGRV